MLWVSVFLPHLAIELRQPPYAGAVAITDGVGARRRVVACNVAARAAGIAPGMDVPAAMLRDPGLSAVDRSKADERRALHAVACWAHQFTSDVCIDLTRWTVWLEVGASLRFFNGLATLYGRIRDGLCGLGYTASFGIAPTPEAAAVLAREPGRLPVINRSELRTALASLPLPSLYIDSRVVDQLHTAGVRTVEELLNIPSAALARRFGAGLPHYLQRLLGERPDVRPRHRAPLRYRRRFDFTDGADSVEGLLFPLRRLLQEFEGYLRGRATAIQQLTVRLQHRGIDDTVLRLVTSTPQHDAVRLFALLREKLERTQLAGRVTDIVLEADEFVAARITQGDLFRDPERANDSWPLLLDKLRARLGADAVRRLGLRDDHRPEKAWCILGEGTSDDAGGDLPDRPLWLLEATPISNVPQLLGTPERIEAGWWTGEDSSRDYYLARTQAGARWWLFREARTDCWFLQGLWA